MIGPRQDFQILSGAYRSALDEKQSVVYTDSLKAE